MPSPESRSFLRFGHVNPPRFGKALDEERLTWTRCIYVREPCIPEVEGLQAFPPAFFYKANPVVDSVTACCSSPLGNPTSICPHIQFGFSYARTYRTTGWISIKLLEIITPKSIWVFYGAVWGACPDVQIRKNCHLSTSSPVQITEKLRKIGFQPVILICPFGSRAEAEKMRHGRIKRDTGHSGFPESSFRKNRSPIEKQSVLSSTRRIIFP